MKLYALIILKFLCCTLIQANSKLNIDEFFNATTFVTTSLSPNGQYLLVHSQNPAWDSNAFENSLWLYETHGSRKKLITKQLSELMKPKWSPSGDWVMYYAKDNTAANYSENVQRYRNFNKKHAQSPQQIHLYNINSKELLSIDIGTETPTALTWADDDSSIFFAAKSSESTEDADRLYEAEWKDVVQYRRRKSNDGSVINRIYIKRKHRKVVVELHSIVHVNFTVSDLLFAPLEHKLVFISASTLLENLSDFDVYGLDLRNTTSLIRFTNDGSLETNLKLSKDGKRVFFQSFPISMGKEKTTSTQQRLKSIDLTNGHIEEWGKGFQGSIKDYAIRAQGGVFILGQLGTNVHIYTQQSVWKYICLEYGWHGSYRSISSSTSKSYSSIAFLHSSFERPEEAYFVKHINGLAWPKAITNENQWLKKRNLPIAKSYRWINHDDNRIIEGILHYPPGKFGHKNLPLLVLIHGGPTDASLNSFYPGFYNWAPLAASEGWLVLEPNYRGSTGYGDQFVNEISCRLLSLPGKDILAGVDSLVMNGIADPARLNIGGYSFGGFLTNWLITQTKRFNAALSGAGVADHVSMWGTADFPTYIKGLICGFPWEVPQIYEKESVISHLDKVKTPTHIITGTNDIRVPTDQSFILERGLNYLGVPVRLILFPNEGHEISNNPWHGKIKVREELKWLEKYGHGPRNHTVN